MRLDRGMDTVADSLITTFDYVWDRLAGRLSELSWSLLDAALHAAPSQALERSAAQARRHWDTMIGCHRRMLEAIDDLIVH